MACCALAVFILGQLYMAIEAVGRALGFAPSAAASANSAADWHRGAEPGMTMATPRFGLPAFGTRLTIAALLCLAALATALIHRPRFDHFDLAAYLADPAHICGAFLSGRR